MGLSGRVVPVLLTAPGTKAVKKAEVLLMWRDLSMELALMDLMRFNETTVELTG